MIDTTPAPLGEVTRRWTQLDDVSRANHVARLVGHVCTSGDPAHVDRPYLDDGRCYQALVPAAVAGDEIALGWMAATHRPLFVTRGRALLDRDPSEWGTVCLCLLHRTLSGVSTRDPRWLRRHVSQRLTARLSERTASYLRRHAREQVSDPRDVLAAAERDNTWEPPLDLAISLDLQLAGLDAALRDGLWALAYDEPLSEVADRYGVTHASLRQRVTRARQRMQPRLARYQRAAA